MNWVVETMARQLREGFVEIKLLRKQPLELTFGTDGDPVVSKVILNSPGQKSCLPGEVADQDGCCEFDLLLFVVLLLYLWVQLCALQERNREMRLVSYVLLDSIRTKSAKSTAKFVLTTWNRVSELRQ